MMQSMALSFSDRLKQAETGSLAKELRGHMADIETHIKRGVPHNTIVEILNEEGYNISLHTFRSILYRYRKSQSIASKKDSHTSSTSPEHSRRDSDESDHTNQVDSDSTLDTETQQDKQQRLEQVLNSRYTELPYTEDGDSHVPKIQSSQHPRQPSLL